MKITSLSAILMLFCFGTYFTMQLRAQGAAAGFLGSLGDALNEKRKREHEVRVNAHFQTARALSRQCEDARLSHDSRLLCVAAVIDFLKIPADKSIEADIEKAVAKIHVALRQAPRQVRGVLSFSGLPVAENTRNATQISSSGQANVAAGLLPPKSIHEVRQGMPKDMVLAGLAAQYQFSDTKVEDLGEGNTVEWIFVWPKSGYSSPILITFINKMTSSVETRMASASTSDAIRLVEALQLAVFNNAEHPPNATKAEKVLNLRSVHAELQTRDIRGMRQGAEEHQLILKIGSTTLLLAVFKGAQQVSGEVSLTEIR